MKTKLDSLRTRTLAVLSSVLAVGALAPQLARVNSNPAAQRQAPTTVMRPPAGAAQAARQATVPVANQAPGQALADLMVSGGADFRDPGCPPHIWGQSAACKKMRLKNVRIGAQPHYRPRARA